MLASIEECSRSLLNNNLAALPTETVYGLAANALSTKAVKKVYDLKGRPSQNPLIVHVLDSTWVDKVAISNHLFRKLADRFWPGPLTLILQSKAIIPRITTGGLDTVALRSPSCEPFRKCLDQTRLYLAAPSANLSKRISPTRAQHVISNFGAKTPPTFDGGPTRHGIESTVLDVSSQKIQLLRHGPIGITEIEEFLDQPIFSQDLSVKEKLRSPGTSMVHYSPIKPLSVYKSFHDLQSCSNLSESIIILPTKHHKIRGNAENVIYLSKNGNSEQISKNLFAAFHEADHRNGKEIKCSLLDLKDDLCHAINDRIKRAGTIID